jgi:hypothetical protein
MLLADLRGCAASSTAVIVGAFVCVLVLVVVVVGMGEVVVDGVVVAAVLCWFAKSACVRVRVGANPPGLPLWFGAVKTCSWML